MNATWGLLTVLGLVCHSESRCSPTTYYKNCWIRRFPGIFINIEESQRRGAQLLKFYQEETALKCSRACCLTRNFSCNLAIFHYDTVQERANCFHLHCPSLESCVLSHRGNVVLYNISSGVDPDLLVFGKYFTSNVRVLPHHYSRGNASDPLPSDKRQFIHPPPPDKLPLASASPVTPSTPSNDVHTTAAQQSTCRLTAASLPTAAAASSSEKTSPRSGTDVQTEPTDASSSTGSVFTAPSSFTTVTSVGPYNSEVTPSSSSSSTLKPFTPTPTHDQTTEPPETSNSPPASTAPTSSEQQTTSTESSHKMNQTTGSSGGQGVSGGGTVTEVGPTWHVAAHTVLVAAAVCVTVLLSCCCSVVLVATWRGQRRRMGRYRTSWRAKKGSMRLIKYVLVRENS